MLSDRQRGWLQDILDNVDAIKRHLDHLAAPDFDSFQSDELVVDAAERCFSRISQAAVKLGDKAEAEIPGLPWNDIRGLGNHLRHAYHTIDLGLIWEVIIDDLGPLEEACRNALGPEPDEGAQS